MRRRAFFGTLRSRLSAMALLAATVGVAIVIAAFNLVLASSLRADVNSRLRARAAAVATTVDLRDGGVVLREAPGDEALDAHVWILVHGVPVRRAGGPPALQRAAVSLAGRSHAYLDVAQPKVRLYAQGVDRRGRRVATVVAGESLAPYDRTTDVALIGTVVLGALLLAALYGVTWWTVARALDPVTQMTRAAAEWSANDLDHRFGAARRPDELGELAATFDALLDRVAASLRHEQRFSAELSHELRTPLARITAELELLQRRERSADDRVQAYERMARSAAQMSRILETLMATARPGARPPRGRATAEEIFRRLSGEWSAPLAERRVALELREPGPEAVAGVDPEVAERILAPVLDNAARHARSAVGVRAERGDGRVRITVHDDGPGVDPGEAEAIFAPGVRGSHADGHGGAGLGLPLARRLARSVGGDVTAVAGGGEGGATFVVELPV